MTTTPSPSEISPRQVANKSDKKALLDAIRMTLAVQSEAVRRNTQNFNRNRYHAVTRIADYEAMKDRARCIKENAIANLPGLLLELEASVRSNGGHFFLAKTATEANEYIRDVLLRYGVKLVVKGKSMTSEETRLNHCLEGAGIKVAESDLGEFILQVADEQPSHIIGPALHYSRERITELFKRKFQTDLPLDTGEELTRFARGILRQQFLSAEAGISGANLIAADSGSIMLVESEGNIRMTTQLPPLHFAIAGIEKVVPSRTDFQPFIELLPASATGQSLTSYVSILKPPLTASCFAAPGKDERPREFHLVLIDNGRLAMREDPVLHEALYCIRCSACLNVCANFETVGGHAFGGETYSGGIGGAWEAGTGKLMNARFSDLCTGCSRCVPQCPVQIDVPWLNENLRQRMNQADGGSLQKSVFGKLTGSAPEDRTAPLQRQFFANYDAVAKWGVAFSSLANASNRMTSTRRLLERTVGIDARRALPALPTETWEQQFRKIPKSAKTENHPRVAVLADAFTNFGSPERGIAVIRILQAIGVDVVLTPCVPDGRGALSQGMIETARQQARAMAKMLQPYLDEGRVIVVVEPTVLAMLRFDFKHLLEDTEAIAALAVQSYEPLELLWNVTRDTGQDLAQLFPAKRSVIGPRLFYHSHCQQRTCNAASQTVNVLRACGFDVTTSSVECCGLAGSFGYKVDYYDLSMVVGADLFAQLANAQQVNGSCAVIASGTSCQEQLHAGTGQTVLHPAQVLESTLSQ